jgi:hypothetical protein
MKTPYHYTRLQLNGVLVSINSEMWTQSLNSYTDEMAAKMGTGINEWINVLMRFSLSAQPIPSHFRGGVQGWGERIPHARKVTPHPCSSPEMGGNWLQFVSFVKFVVK